MIHENAEVVARYPEEQVRDAYHTGVNEGYTIITRAVTVDDVLEHGEAEGHDCGEDAAVSLACECEMNGREFSPFEFLARDFNTARDAEGEPLADEMWAAYEAGICDGARIAWWQQVVGEA